VGALLMAVGIAACGGGGGTPTAQSGVAATPSSPSSADTAAGPTATPTSTDVGASTSATASGTCAQQVSDWYARYGRTEVANFHGTVADITKNERDDAAASIIEDGRSFQADTSPANPVNVPMPPCGDPAGAWPKAVSGYATSGGYAVRLDVPDSVKFMTAANANLATATREIATVTPL
jgi:hypothetical protein